MTPIEDQIRETLRSEAGRLREMRPLHLPPHAAGERRQARAVSRAWHAPRLCAWLGPAVAATVVVLVAATLVTLRSLNNEPTSPGAAASAGYPSLTAPVAGPPLAAGATPRYYVKLDWAPVPFSWAIMVGDEQTGKTIATYPLPKGGTLSSAAVSGAADDRTFIVSANTTRGLIGPPIWYLVQISPGSGIPVKVTKLPIDYPAKDQVRATGLSADATELAVVSFTDDGPLQLQVFSVNTGHLQHSWSTGFTTQQGPRGPVSDLTWVGDRTLGFAVTRSPEVREEVRMLDVGSTGSNLMADSRLVWSQYIPAAPHGTQHAPHTCDTPYLTGDGQAVVCGNETYSAKTGRLTAVWLAYPLATPTRARVIGRAEQPSYVNKFNGIVSVDWVNPSGTEVIGSWNPTNGVQGPGGAGAVTNRSGVVENGKVTLFHRVPGPEVAW